MSVYEAKLCLLWRRGAPVSELLIVQGNLAGIYKEHRRLEDAMLMQQGVYSGKLRIFGEEHESTILAAANYVTLLMDQNRNKEAKSLLCKTLPAARRVLGEHAIMTLWLTWH